MTTAATSGAATTSSGAAGESAATRGAQRGKGHGGRTGGRSKSRSDTRMTSRGVGTLSAGIVVSVLGVGLATPVLVYVGVAMTCAVVVAWCWTLVAARSFVRTHARVHREVTPYPLTAGVPGQVAVTIEASGRGRGAWLRRAATEHVDLREQAAAELTGGIGTKASVDRGDGSLTLRYGLHPTLRGRWPLGPALIHNSDPFGMVLSDTPVGHPELVPVWPAIVDLSGTAGALMGHADRVVLGARTPAADDASLRDYREGDDMRRVHWASSARRGTMLVRSDERAGRRPATVILDPPREPLALERAISAAASIAVSVLGSGHPVRLVGAGLEPEAIQHLGDRGGDAARYDLLNQTVELHSPVSRAAATTELVRTARLVGDDARHGEVTVAVIEPLADAALAALVPLGESGRAWAIVRTDAEVADQARRSVEALRKAGWRATTAHADQDFADLWTRMLSAGDIG